MPSELAIWAAQRRPRRISITVSSHVFEALIARSSREGRSVSNLAAFVLERGMEDSQPQANP